MEGSEVGNIQKRILFAAWFLSILSFLLIVASTLIHRHRTCYDVLPWVKAPITEITDELGNAFMGYLGVEWMSAHKRPSPAQVLEQGTPLLHGNAFHDDIRKLGEGRFSFWHDYVYFSASDSTDPRTNGRLYEIYWAYPIPDVIAWTVYGLTLVAIGGLFFFLFTCLPDWISVISGGIDRFRQIIPPVGHNKLTLTIFAVFFVVIISYLPEFLSRADVTDKELNRSVLTIGDDGSYQTLALNFLHGLGFSDAVSLPLETYHLDLDSEFGAYIRKTYEANGGIPPSSLQFYRAPGFPLLLSATYAIFGNQTLIARRMMAVLTWLTAVLLLLTGSCMAGWLGALAGGIVALSHLNYSPLLDFERILTEIPSAFWVTLFAFLFTVYLKKDHISVLILSAISLAGIILTRANFLCALPLILAYLYLQRHRLRELVIFGAIVSVPVVAWSMYASLKLGRPVMMSTQGHVVFADCNNVDTLEGIGPRRWNQGAWNPGWELREDGSWVNTARYSPKPGESGWIKGLTFWKENITQLPRLFYVKLRVGFWYNDGAQPKLNWISPGTIFLIAIGFLFIAVGLRVPKRVPSVLLKIESRKTLLLQLGLIAVLVLMGSRTGFWQVVVVWFLILLVALLRPYGDYYRLPFVSPVWFLAFIVSHAVTTVLFLGVRYHQPLDGLLMLFGVLGLLVCLYELVKRSPVLSVSFLMIGVWVFSCWPDLRWALTFD
jgi:hypothetical protein